MAVLIAQAPAVVFIVTSRERLNLRHEWIVDVPGLSVPPPGPIERVADYSALQLLAEGVERVLGRTLAPEEWPPAARICQLVAGLPLALELVAAWTRTHPFAEIVREIEQNLDFVAAPLIDLPERHRSLRAVFNQSWHC